ncbi:MAG: 4-hydroxy-2-oxovalerate aldolase, partial [Actinophytocola sp.]|nr:4-hydroxy-2-oxovalerate aldolase [Actinophytocola sp.]
DVMAALATAEEVVQPYMQRQPTMDRNSVVMGYAGVYSSFLLHAERASERYGVAAHELLLEAGRRGYVGGQEDMIIPIALEIQAEQAGAA